MASRIICGRKQSGFSLIELMLVVAIVAILAKVALPIYTDYVVQSKLSEPISQLSLLQTRMEQYYLDNKSYSNACTSPNVAVPSSLSYFSYTCVASGDTYTLTATGSNSAVSGFTYTVDQVNNRATTSAPSGWTTNTSCWVTKRDGGCS